MPNTLTWVQNDEMFRTEITEEPDGFRAVRHAWIDTDDVASALLDTTGMPPRGQPFEAATPNLLLAKKVITPWGVNCLARFEYATPGLGGGVFDYPARIGKPVTTLVPTKLSVNARAFLLKENDAPYGLFEKRPLIAEGQGVPKDVGMMELRVKVAYALSNLAAVPWSRLTDLHTEQARNDQDVTAPNVFASGYAKPCPAKTLRYLGAEFEHGPDTLTVVHIMAEARTHRVEYEELDEDGKATGTKIRGQIYDLASFAGLW